MANLLLFRESLPLILDLRNLILPLFANDLGNFGIREAGVLRDNARLVMLSI